MPIVNCQGAALPGNCTDTSFTCCIDDNLIDILLRPALRHKRSADENPEDPYITRDLFLRILGDNPRNQRMYELYVQTLSESGIAQQTKKPVFNRVSFLAQLIGESNYFSDFESTVIDNDFDETLGNNQEGDGDKYRARGVLRLRGRASYQLANESIVGLNKSLIDEPTAMIFPKTAFKVAAWQWVNWPRPIDREPVNLIPLTDGTFHNFALLTHYLNSSLDQLKLRSSFNDLVLSEMSYTSMKRGQDVECQINPLRKGYSVPVCLSTFKRPYCGCLGDFQEQSCPGASGQCNNSGVIKCCSEVCRHPLDLAILIDSSNAVTQLEFQNEKKFVADMIDKLLADNALTRIAIVNYGSSIEVITDLNMTLSSSSLRAIIDSMKYLGGSSMLNEALDQANNQVFQTTQGMRDQLEGVARVIIVLANGTSKFPEETVTNAALLKQRGINIMSMGLGDDRDVMNELMAISSNRDNHFQAEDAQDLSSQITAMANRACVQPAEYVGDKIELAGDLKSGQYKFVKYSLKNNSENIQNLILEQLVGRLEGFYSFEDEQPRSPDDFLADESFDPLRSEPYRFNQVYSLTKSCQNITINNESEYLYLSVRGTSIFRSSFRLTSSNDDKCITKTNSANSIPNIEWLLAFCLVLLSLF